MKSTRAVYAALLTMTLILLTAVCAFAQRSRPGAAPLTSVQPQPLFSEYKGIRLGITSREVRAKLGEPTLKAEDQDYYLFSDVESAQIAYDQTQKVVTISIDYSGREAPDPRNIVGTAIEASQDGSLYKLVRYQAQRFWVSYSRTSGASPIVTITIQKM